jgi:signal peptidase I
MEISISAFIILSIVYFIAAHVGLYKIFEKMGEDGWKALVPFYGTYLAVKMVKKSWVWTIVYYVPFLGFVVWMGLIVELMKLLGKTDFKEHFLGVVFAGIYLPYIGFKDDVKFIGYDEAAKYKKSFKREWADAIIFAVVAATVIRGFYLEAFTIPTSSMEQKLLVGDFLFVNKMAYGARVPNTPVSFPFTHHSFPESIPFIGGNQSYLELFQFPYAKLPKMGDVERNDCVVFNFPAGDTVITEQPARIYEQVIRDASVELKVSEDQARKYINENYTIKARPVDKKENYIKRCVGLPGDKLEIVNAQLMIDDKAAYFDANAQFNYNVETDGTGFSQDALQKKKITTEDLISIDDGMNDKYIVTMTDASVEKIKQFSQVTSVEKRIQPIGYKGWSLNAVFPNDSQYDWTIDNFGPILVPKKGATVELSIKTLPLYRRIIKNYENNDLNVNGDQILINGEVANSYTFKMDYYWMMGDNRHNSQDSRYWGFVPEDHIVGKAVFVWMSWDSQQGEIRWDRLFSLVH